MKPHDIAVINYDLESEPGSHWVLTFNSPQHDHVLFFDSYGIPPGEEILDYLHTAKKPIQFSTSEIQEWASILCGYYCIYIAKELNHGKSFYDAVYTFDPWPSERNQRVMTQIAKTWDIPRA
jgi:hypothetical protein